MLAVVLPLFRSPVVWTLSQAPSADAQPTQSGGSVRSQLISSSHTRRLVAAAVVVVVSLHLPLAAREPLPRARILTQQPADCEKVRGSSGGRRRIMSVSCAQLGSTRETNIQTCSEKSLAGEHSQAQAGAPLA